MYLALTLSEIGCKVDCFNSNFKVIDFTQDITLLLTLRSLHIEIVIGSETEILFLNSL